MADVADGAGRERQVELIGPVGGVLAYVIAIGLIAAGPAMSLSGDSLADGLCPGIVTLPIGILLAANTYEWRRTAKRYRDAAVPGTAEVVAVRRTRIDGDSDQVAEVMMRISGAGFDTFEAEGEIPFANSRPKAGDTWKVMVDPRDGTFALGYDHLFED